jgi:O-antigen ligase
MKAERTVLDDSDFQPTTHARLSRNLDAAIGLVVFATPVAMVFSRESPVALLGVLAALATAKAVAEDGRAVLKSLGVLAQRRETALLVAALTYIALSVSWSVVPERGGMFALHMAATAIGAIALFTFGRQVRPEHLALGLPIGLALAALVVLIEMKNGLPIRSAFGLTTEPFRLNRASMAIALFLPVALLALWRTRAWLLTLPLAALCAYAVFTAVSSSAQLALMVAAATIPVAALAPRALHWLAAASLAVATLAAPIYLSAFGAFIPASMRQQLTYGTFGLRAEMWSIIAQQVWERPFFGYGIETSSFLQKTPIAQLLTSEQLSIVTLGHPHNGILQIWADLGLVGALLATALILAGFRLVERHVPHRMLPLATGLAVAFYAITFVSHGAWQAWWPCLAVIVSYAAALARREVGAVSR